LAERGVWRHAMTALQLLASLRERRWRVAFWLAVAAGIVLALWPQPDPSEPWFEGADKVEHALSFALLLWMGRRAGYRKAPALTIGLLALGGGIELAQGLTATRSADWIDWLADAVGIALGWAVTWLGSRGRAEHSIGLEQEHGR
jgi:VanZ family protein